MISFRRAFAALLILIGCTTIASADALRVVETKHYRLHTDLDQQLVDSLGQRMDAMWEEYSRRLQDFPLPPENGRFDAYLFAKKADFVKLTGDRLPNAGGVYIPSEKLLAAFLESQGRENLKKVLQHEAFHQFAHVAVGDNLPIWLNEGLAQAFEEGIWTGDRFMLGQVPASRVTLLQNEISQNKLTPFKDFLALSDEQWISNMRDRTVGERQYNQAWAMTQFLIYGNDANGHPLFVDDLIDMLKLVHHGVKGSKAFELAFSDNYQGFELMFKEWAHNLAPSVRAEYRDKQAALADVIVQLYGNGDRFRSIDSLRQYLSACQAPTTCLCDLHGTALPPRQLYLASRDNSPTPDLICQPTPDLRLRTQFVMDASTLSYETFIDTP